MGWQPVSCPHHLSDKAKELVRLTNLVPAGQWVTYGDLAEASGMGTAGSAARAVASALSFAAVDLPPEEWAVPWHRIRMQDGRLKGRGSGVVDDPGHVANVLFAAEGGQLIGASAREGRRFPLAAMLRTGRLS